jgi:hypothetical protein
MNRRIFLKRLGAGVVTAAVVSAVPLLRTEVTGFVYPGWRITTSQILSIDDLRRLQQQLISRNVQPHMTVGFRGVIHPFVLNDLERIA